MKEYPTAACSLEQGEHESASISDLMGAKEFFSSEANFQTTNLPTFSPNTTKSDTKWDAATAFTSCWKKKKKNEIKNEATTKKQEVNTQNNAENEKKREIDREKCRDVNAGACRNTCLAKS